MDVLCDLCFFRPKECIRVLKTYCGNGSPKPREKDVEAALKELGVCEKDVRRSIAEDLSKIISQVSRSDALLHGSSNNKTSELKNKAKPLKSAIARVVQHFAKSKNEINLLRILQDRFSDIEKFSSLQRTMEQYEAEKLHSSGLVSVKNFDKCLDSIGLDFDDQQRKLVTELFIASGKDHENEKYVKFRCFLAVLNPEHSVNTNTRSRNPPSSSSTSTSGQFEGDLLRTLEYLRGKILIVQSMGGLDTRESFSHFDPSGSGIVTIDEFLQGLEALGIRTDDDNLARDRIMRAFGTCNEDEGIDYGQFLRFLENDYTASLGFSQTLSPEYDSDFDKNLETLSDDSKVDRIVYHDTNTAGPFVAGYTDGRTHAKIRSAQQKRVTLAKESEGTFVRSSQTSAGIVKQIIISKPPSSKRRHGARVFDRVERHHVERHSSRCSQDSRNKEVYEGVLKTSSPRYKAKRQSSQDRFMTEAAKPNAVVKYLGYAAHVCNDYPHIDYQKFQKEKKKSSSILVRNFARQKPSKKGSIQRKERENSSERRETNEYLSSEDDDDFAESQMPQSDVGTKVQRHLIEIDQKRSYVELELLRDLLTLKTSPQRPNAKGCMKRWGEIVLADRKSMTPTLTEAIKEQFINQAPFSSPLRHLIRASMAAQDASSLDLAKEMILRAEKIFKVAFSEQLLNIKKHAFPQKTIKSPRLHFGSLSFDPRALRNMHCSAIKSTPDAPTVSELADMLVGQVLGGVEPFDKVVQHIIGSDLLEDNDEDLHDVQNQLAKQLQQMLHKTSLSSKVSWEELLAIFRSHATYQMHVSHLQNLFTDGELCTLRAVFSQAQHQQVSTQSRQYQASEFLGKKLSQLGQCNLIINALYLDKHVESFLDERMLKEVEERFSEQYELISWEEFLATIACHASDTSLEELYIWIQEVRMDLELTDHQSCQAKRVRKEQLNSLSEQIEDLYQDRLDIVCQDAHHPSLIKIHKLMSCLRETQFRLRTSLLEDRIEEKIDRYLCSRSGKFSIDDIIASMLKADSVKRVSVSSRASIELAARAMLRKRKELEFRSGPAMADLRSLRREACQYVEIYKSSIELVFGHESLKAALALAQCANLYLSFGDKKRRSLATEFISMILGNLEYTDDASLPYRMASTEGSIRLGKLKQQDKHYCEAGRLFTMAAKIVEVDGPMDTLSQKASDLWKHALSAYEHVHDCTDQRLEASGRILALLSDRSSDEEKLNAYEKHCLLLLDARLPEQAVRILRQAKTLAKTREQKIKLARLKASATASVQLLCIKNRKEKEGDTSETKLQTEAEEDEDTESFSSHEEKQYNQEDGDLDFLKHLDE